MWNHLLGSRDHECLIHETEHVLRQEIEQDGSDQLGELPGGLTETVLVLEEMPLLEGCDQRHSVSGSDLAGDCEDGGSIHEATMVWTFFCHSVVDFETRSAQFQLSVIIKLTAVDSRTVKHGGERVDKPAPPFLPMRPFSQSLRALLCRAWNSSDTLPQEWHGLQDCELGQCLKESAP